MMIEHGMNPDDFSTSSTRSTIRRSRRTRALGDALNGCRAASSFSTNGTALMPTPS